MGISCTFVIGSAVAEPADGTIAAEESESANPPHNEEQTPSHQLEVTMAHHRIHHGETIDPPSG